MQASSTTTTIITPKDVYVHQHAVDQQTVQILQKLHQESTEPRLQELLSRGREAIDVCWSVYDHAAAHDEIRHTAKQAAVHVQFVTMFEDMMDYQDANPEPHSTRPWVEWTTHDIRRERDWEEMARQKAIQLEEFAIFTSLMCCCDEEAYRNYHIFAQERIRGRMDAIAEHVREYVPTSPSLSQLLDALQMVFFEIEGFMAVDQGRYDYHNFLLHSVLERKKGDQVTLAILFKCIARRLGIWADIIRFDRHYLAIRLLNCYIDIQHGGRILQRQDLEGRYPMYVFIVQSTPNDLTFLFEQSNRQIMYHITNPILNDGWQRPMMSEEGPTTFLKEAVKLVNSLLDRVERPRLLMDCYRRLYNTWILPPHRVSSERDDDGAYIAAASE